MSGGASGLVTGEQGVEALSVFDEAEVRTYELTLDPAVWADLQLNARDEQYGEASLDVGGTHLDGVALRFKGSAGTLTSCFNDAGQQTCSKLSMKLKLDEYDPTQRLDGLKRINFHSMIWDPSQLRERLGYRVYRQMGIVAPRSVHARVVVNGEYLGLFSLVEDVDGRFAADRFVAGNGNLYKEQWPDTDDEAALTSRLETNEDVADHTGIRQFHAELVQATASELPEVVARYTDVDQLLSYLAVDRSIVNWDGATAFYCYDVDCENHNYYLYQDEATPRFTLIPWDLDNTFDLANPLEAVPDVFQIPADCSVRFEAFGKLVMAPACDPLLQGLARTDPARYVAALDRLLDGPFQLSNLERSLDEIAAQIEPLVAEDPNGPGLGDFQQGVNNVRNILPTLRERALADRNSRP